ncbi:MAG: LamG-like jellyroll fold domain-containing protein [Bacteroidota bacterium]
MKKLIKFPVALVFIFCWLFSFKVQANNSNFNKECHTANRKSTPDTLQFAERNNFLTSDFNALHFDGVDDYVSIPHYDGYQSDEFTLEAWVNWNETTGEQTIFSKWGVGGNASYELVIDDGEVKGKLHGTDEVNYEVKTTIPRNRWVHLALTRDADAFLNLYVNGELVHRLSNVPPMNTSNKDFAIGSENNQTDFFKGRIDEVRIWRGVARTAEQISLARSCSPTKTACFPELTHYFTFSNDVWNTTTLMNIGNQGNADGTLHNFSLTGGVSAWVDLGVSVSRNCDELVVGNLENFSFGTQRPDDGVVSIVYSILNQRLVDRTINRIESSGPNFTLTGFTNNTVVSVGDTATFQIDFNPTSLGIKESTITIYFESCLDEMDSFSFNVVGVGGSGFANALNFDGVDDIVEVPSVPNLDIGNNQVTLEAWVNLALLPSELEQPFAGIYDARQDAYVLYLDRNNRALRFKATDTDGTAARVGIPETLLTTNQWHHVAGVYDGDSSLVKIYLDGQRINSVSQPNLNSAVKAGQLGTLGGQFSSTGGLEYPFRGSIDEVRVWKTARKDTQIDKFKNCQLSVACNDDLVLYYDFNQNLPIVSNVNDTILIDRTTTNNNGVLKNFSLFRSTSNWIAATETLQEACTPFIMDYAEKTDFGVSFPDSTERVLSYPIFNAGSQTIQISNIVSENNDFIIEDFTPNSTILPLDTLVFSIRFKPSRTGKQSANISISSVDCDNVVTDTTFTVSGEGGLLSTHLALGQSNDRVTMPVFTGLDDKNNQVTLELWVKLNQLPTEITQLFAGIYDSPSDAYVLYLDKSKNELRFKATDENSIAERPGISGADLTKDTWYHIAGVYDGTKGTCSIYLNGALKDVHHNPAMTGLVKTGQTATLGGQFSSFNFDGAIDEVRIWNTARSQFGITQNKDCSLDPIFHPNLIAYYPFNQIVSSEDNTQQNRLEDATIYKNNGTLSGFAFLGTTSNWITSNSPISGICNLPMENDAYVNINWTLEKERCFLDEDGEAFFNGAYVSLTADGLEIYNETVFNTARLSDLYVNDFRHTIGPSQSRDYQLTVYEIGPGRAVCSHAISGGTLPFQAPEWVSISDNDYPDSIHLQWRNHSKLSSSFSIYRENELIAEVSGSTQIDSVFSFTDMYQLGNPASLMNGDTAMYRIETFSALMNQSYASITAEGSTYPTLFVAKGDNSLEKIDLSWNNLSDFCDRLELYRNGKLLTALSQNALSFPDGLPTPGKINTYGLRLFQNDVLRMEVQDTAQIAKNGLIAGLVLTKESNYPVPNTIITLTGTTDEGTITRKDTTNALGQFSFNQLYYDNETDFTLVASLGNTAFRENNLVATLNLNQPTEENLLFLAEAVYEETTDTIAIQNFTATPVELADHIVLAWEYAFDPNQTTFFNIYRESDLIGQLNDAGGVVNNFIEKQGIPSTNYNYAIEAFQNKEGIITKKRLLTSATFPTVAPVTGFMASAAQDGKVSLNWGPSHTSNNFAGFILYRDGVEVAILGTTDFSFVDSLGIFGKNTTYEIEALRSINGLRFRSVRESIVLDYPTLPVATDLTATALENEDKVRLSWTVPSALLPTFNYQGLAVYRKASTDTDFTLIDQIDKIFSTEVSTMVYDDLTGIPNQNYEYEVRTVANNGFEGRSNSAQTIFPSVTPSNPISANNAIGAVTINDIGSSSDNIAGFLVLGNAGDTLAYLNAGATTYTHYANNPAVNNINYELKAYREVAGERYFSTSRTTTGSPAAGSVNPRLPENVTASDDLPNHIKLCWEYPAFVLAEFIILSGTDTLAVMPPTARAYYDYTAPNGQLLEYSVIARYENSVAQPVKVAGMRKSFKRAQGRVYKNDSRKGVPNVLIKGTAAGYKVSTRTDKAGFYRLEQLPVAGTENIRLTAFAPNSDFSVSSDLANTTSIDLTIQDSQDIYSVNFIDYYLPSTEQDSIAAIEKVTAIPNTAEMMIDLFWSTSNAHYSGFEIYRTGTLIGEVLKGNSLTFRDTEGTYGMGYEYQILPYWDTELGRIYGAGVIDFVYYPALDPVKYFSATPFNAKNRLRLNWGHPYDTPDFYEIYRNDELIGVVNKNSPQMFYDTTGTPGQLYRYAIIGKRGSTMSAKVTIEAYYPLVDRVQNLIISVPEHEADAQNTQNHIRLDWAYESRVVDGFEIYRANELIAQVADTTRFYQDFTGEPNLDYEYQVIPLVEKENQQFRSLELKVNGNYPVLAYPTSVQLSSALDSLNGDSLGGVRIAIFQDVPANEGFNIYRDGQLIQTHTHPNLSDTLITYDFEGMPEMTHTWEVKSFSERNGTAYQSPGVQRTFEFPAIPMVPSFIAVNNVQTYRLNWTYNRGVAIDGFEIHRENELLATLSKDRRWYHLLLPTAQLTKDGTYQIRAFKNINGQPVFSQSKDLQLDGLGFETSSGVDTVSSVSASDGTFTNQTRIEWALPNDYPTVDGFRIYQDGEVLAEVGASQQFYIDLDGVPGKTYVYSVVGFTASAELVPKMDTGYKLADGVLAGEVKTLTSNVGVNGVTITATAEVEGAFYTYTTQTDNSGTFSFNTVFYGASTAKYQLTAHLDNHSFTPESRTAQLTFNQNTQNGNFFFDETAYIVRGQINPQNTDCRLADIEVKAISYFRIGNTKDVTTRTTETGTYSLVVNPNRPGLTSLKIKVEDIQISTNTTIPDSTIYNFVASGQDSFTLVDFNNFPLLQELNFSETTNYPVEIVIQNTCKLPISNDQFSIRIKSIDGCYDQTFKTFNNGKLTLNLPPLNYTLSVVDVSNLSASNVTVLNYFKNRPQLLDLASIHKNEASTLSDTEIRALTKRVFSYHTTPTISLLKDFPSESYVCDDNTSFAALEQGQTYQLAFAVNELQNNLLCPVKEGYLKISNAAARTENTILQYDANLDAFEPYTFTASDPLIVPPYIYNLTVEYFSADNDFLGTFSKSIIVQGDAAIPGTDVIVNPDSAGSEINFPLFILRDPPGDASFSTIGKGKTIQKSITVADETTGAAGLVLESSFLTIAGSFFEGEFLIGGGNTGNLNWEYEITTTQAISTLDDPTQIGRKADVIVGAGIAMAYGFIKRLRVERCDSISLVKQIGVAPNKINTTWVFTVAQIEDIIKQAKEDSLKITQGTLTLVEGGTQLSVEEALRKNNIRISNWQKILEYHDVNTVPYYQVCNTKSKQYENSAFKREIKTWQENTCPLFGTYDTDGTFQLKEDIVWTQSLLDTFTAMSNAIRNLSEEVPDPNTPLKWGYGEDITSYVDAEYEAIFGTNAENITFSGGTSLTKTINSGKASSKEFSNSFTFNSKVSAGAAFSTEVSLGLFGAEAVIHESDGKFGGVIETGYNITESRSRAESNTVEIEYTLSDDDAGDQFSTFVFQGLSQNHTPYFVSLGGRSSCPPIPDETILRDAPSIYLIDAENGSLSKELSLHGVPANEAATFHIQITNGNPFGENRDLTVYLENSSNLNGAFVRVGSELLGEDTYLDMAAGQPLTLPLTIERGLSSHEHVGLLIGLKPFCRDGVFNTGDTDFITVNVHFANPCMPTTIVNPGNNWLLNSNNNQLPITVRDYDAGSVESMELEYRRTDVPSNWDLIRINDLGLTATVGADELENTQDYNFVWTLPNSNFYQDGNYEVRIKTTCQNGTVSYSNIVEGRINQSGLQLFGTPEPADGFWIPGDEISISFDKNVDCAQFNDPDFVAANLFVVDKTTDDTLDFRVACRENKLIFTTDEAMSIYDGHLLEVTAQSIAGLLGNVSDTARWSFKVVTQQLYWNQDTLQVQLYEGETQNLTLRLENINSVAAVENINLVAKDGQIDNWLSLQPSSNFDVAPTGQPITIQLTGNQPIGEYIEVIQVNGLGVPNPPEVVVQLIIIPQAPNWQVNPANFAGSMNLVANWRFTDGASTTLSIDEKDQISVWVENTIRGVANIEKVGLDFYAAYLTVSGGTSDQNKTLQFRVWDASSGTEYEAFPETPISFVVDTLVGTTALPQELLVNASENRVTYIPLNKGWTWFSVPTQLVKDDLNNALQSLTNATTGDLMKSQNGFAEYQANGQWVSEGTDTLRHLAAGQGYMIFLQNGPDTLRLVGGIPTPSNIQLTNNWNWIGCSFPAARPINEAITISNLTTNDVIKTIRQDGTAPFAIYDGSSWTGSLAELRPADTYKISMQNGSGGLLTFSNGFRGEQDSEKAQSRSTTSPENPNSWEQADFNYQYTIPLIAQVDIGEGLTTDTNDKLAVFVGNDLRGVGQLIWSTELNKHLISMLIGGVNPEEAYDLYYHDNSADTVAFLNAPLQLSLDEAGRGSTNYGSYATPYLLGEKCSGFSAAFTVNDRTPEPHLEVVQFIPSKQDASFTYEWAFGDGRTSNEMLPRHIYTSNDLFDVTLKITSDDDCELVDTAMAYIQTDGSIICESTLDTDEDGIGDDCDNCPTLSNANQSDIDGDGTGDRCDCLVDNPNDRTLNFFGTIAPATHQTSFGIISNGQVEANTKVTFKAGKAILLSPGFHAKANGMFTAVIDPCRNEVEEVETSKEAQSRNNTQPDEPFLINEFDFKLVPNPTSGHTSVQINLAEATAVQLSLLDVRGGLVKQLISRESLAKGPHQFEFDLTNQPAGVYYFVLKQASGLQTRKLILY